MDKRVRFLPGQQQQFLSKIGEVSRFSSDDLAAIAGVVGRSYRDWKRGKLNMSLKASRKLSLKFDVPLPEKEFALITRAREYKSEKGKIGGYAHFRKYGSPGTSEGRRKGGSKVLAILRARGVIPERKQYVFPPQLSSELAEFVGILLGDGGITKWQVCVTLNTEADRDYIGFVKELGLKLFQSQASWWDRKNCMATTVSWSGLNLVEYLMTLGLKSGNKVKHQVGVPQWITENSEFSLSCLRGLMDTDGGIFLHTYRVNGKRYSYPKLSFSNRSMPILMFVYQFLHSLDLGPKTRWETPNKQVWLYNHKAVSRYLQIVGTHNPRLLKNTKEESDSLAHSGSLLNS